MSCQVRGSVWWVWPKTSQWLVESTAVESVFDSVTNNNKKELSGRANPFLLVFLLFLHLLLLPYLCPLPSFPPALCHSLHSFFNYSLSGFGHMPAGRPHIFCSVTPMLVLLSGCPFSLSPTLLHLPLLPTVLSVSCSLTQHRQPNDETQWLVIYQ